MQINELLFKLDTYMLFEGIFPTSYTLYLFIGVMMHQPIFCWAIGSEISIYLEINNNLNLGYRLDN